MNRGVLLGLRGDRPYRTVGDVNVALLPSDRVVVFDATLTSTKLLGLASAASVPAGTVVTVVDNGAVGAFTVVCTAVAGDSLVSSSAMILAAPKSRLQFVSDGNRTWYGVPSAPLGVEQGGTGGKTAAEARTGLELGAAALLATPIPVASGGTGSASQAYSVAAIDTAPVTATNPTSLTTLLASTDALANNSVAVGDRFEMSAGGTYINSANSTFRMQLLLGAVAIFDYTTASLTLHASARKWLLEVNMEVIATGAGGTMQYWTRFMVTPAAAGTPTTMSLGAAAAGDMAIGSNVTSTAVDFTSPGSWDLKTLVAVTGSSVVRRYFRINKFPA